MTGRPVALLQASGFTYSGAAPEPDGRRSSYWVRRFGPMHVAVIMDSGQHSARLMFGIGEGDQVCWRPWSYRVGSAVPVAVSEALEFARVLS